MNPVNAYALSDDANARTARPVVTISLRYDDIVGDYRDYGGWDALAIPVRRGAPGSVSAQELLNFLDYEGLGGYEEDEGLVRADADDGGSLAVAAAGLTVGEELNSVRLWIDPSDAVGRGLFNVASWLELAFALPPPDRRLVVTSPALSAGSVPLPELTVVLAADPRQLLELLTLSRRDRRGVD